MSKPEVERQKSPNLGFWGRIGLESLWIFCKFFSILPYWFRYYVVEPAVFGALRLLRYRYRVVTENLRKVTSYAAKHEARFMKLLTEQTENGSKRRNAAKKKELEAAEKRIAELSAIFKRLYEDSVTGRISDERFTELSADYEAEQKELKERAAVLQGELSRTLEATANAEKFMKVVRKYTSFEELTPTLLREFVEKIVIHESESLDGKRRGKLRRQEIEIYYSFVGKVELPD